MIEYLCERSNHTEADHTVDIRFRDSPDENIHTTRDVSDNTLENNIVQSSLDIVASFSDLLTSAKVQV